MKMLKFQLNFKLLSTFIVFTFIFVSNIAAQNSKVVESIDIAGNRRLSDEYIIKNIKTKVGDFYSEKRLQEDLQSILKTGLFDALSSKIYTEEGRRGGIAVIFQVRELPLIVEFHIIGLQNISDDEILNELRKNDAEIGVGMPYQPEKLRKVRRVITKYLSEIWFDEISIDFTTEEVTSTTIKLQIIIKSESEVRFIPIEANH